MMSCGLKISNPYKMQCRFRYKCNSFMAQAINLNILFITFDDN